MSALPALAAAAAALTSSSSLYTSSAAPFFSAGSWAHLWLCDAGAPNAQAWTQPASAPTFAPLTTRDGALQTPFAVYNASFAANYVLVGMAAAPGTTGAFALNASLLQVKGSGSAVLCVQPLLGLAFHGAALQAVPCNASNPLQRWSYSGGDGTLRPASNASLCLDAGSTVTCDPSVDMYCNVNASTPARVADLISRLDVPQLSALLYAGLIVESYYGENAGLPALGVPPLWSGECLHGAVAVCGQSYTSGNYSSTGCATSFPSGMAMGGSFNRSAWRSAGEAIASEVRGLNGQTPQLHGLVCWAPNINGARDPRWGRGHEVAGESALVLSEYVAVFAAALQQGEDTRYLKTISTAKHATGYDLENSDGVTRVNFDASIRYADWVEYYVPAFLSAVQRAGVRSIMASYNALSLFDVPVPQGVPAVADAFFLQRVLRDAWGFDGFVVSDCGAVGNVETTYHYAANASGAVAAVLNAGLDMECGNFIPQYATEAVASGQMSLATLQTSASRVLSAWVDTGLLNPPDAAPYGTYGAANVDTPEHRQLALEIALQGITLLQNNASSVSPNGAGTPILPLTAAKLRNVAVVGPHAASTTPLLGNYSPINTVVLNQSVLAGVQRRGAAAGFNVTYAEGCIGIACNDTALFPQAVAVAAAADVTIVVLGLCSDSCPGGAADSPYKESEGRDRRNLTLPNYQEALVAALVATGKPIVVVLVHGGPVDISSTKAAAPAIVTAWYPGQMGGDAVTGILFGDVSPSGRSAYTWYPQAFAAARNVTDMILPPHNVTLANGSEVAVPGITYLYTADADALWPFGWGLSYTSFTYTWLDAALAYREVNASDVAAVGSAALAPRTW